MKKNHKQIKYSSLGVTFVKTVVAGVIAGIVSKVVFELIVGYAVGTLGKFIVVALCAMLLFVVYLVLLIILRTEEIKNLIKRKV